MIGQVNLLNELDDLIIRSKYPQFMILCGPSGSGKELISKYICNKLGATFISCGNKVDEIRDIIQLAYGQIDKILYFFDHGDNMSPQARNALLKIVEEPPTNAYFILTTEDSNNVMPTLKSRGSIFNVDCYSPNDLIDYLNLNNYKPTNDEQDIIINICDTPGDIDKIVNLNIIDFYNFVNLVLDNLGQVSGVNAFKIASKIKFKEDDSAPYDLQLFIKMLQYVATNRALNQNSFCLYEINKFCSLFRRRLSKTYNKSMNFDVWLLSIKEALENAVI